MILLALPFAALLSFGWPALRVEFVPASTALPAGLTARIIPQCCGSMRPAIRGGETAYVETYTHQSLLGCIVSNGKWLHQVTAESASAVRTAGLSNHHSDIWTAKADIEYIVRYIIRK